MRKFDELTRPDTCMQHAHPQEMTFVLLSRDAAAPATYDELFATLRESGYVVDGVVDGEFSLAERGGAFMAAAERELPPRAYKAFTA